ncbi:hypothetical protein ACHAWX_002061 [Stephanocyclus meneghinianus]
MSPNNESQPIAASDELTPLHRNVHDTNNFHEFINVHDNDHGVDNSELHRHLSLFDLVCIGVGATVGSGIYVVTGLIAHTLAGPATFISWSIAGMAACASGLCYAEQGGRFPSAGSTYVYAKETMGERASVIAASCLTLEYVGSASAVARSWGDKVVEYVRSLQGNSAETDGVTYLLRILDPGMGINPCAFLVSSGAVLLLLNGVKESKFVTNLFTTLNVTLLLFMAGLALFLAKADNMSPLIPPQFGVSGIIRGATSSFFGYIGFDEICCIAGEAVDPAKNMPRAIILTLVIVTSLYITASIGLVGMVPYEEISETSGFPNGFRYRSLNWAAQIAALGELIALPFVVLVTIMAQPRLQYAMARDGILPAIFAEVDEFGNLINGLKISGALMTAVATLIPFAYLDDLISSGILIAFTITDASVILVRRKSPLNRPSLLKNLLTAYMAASLISGFLLRSWLSNGETGGGVFVLTILSCVTTVTLGYLMQNQCESEKPMTQGLFLTPFVPILPLVGIFINLYLIAQLELTGLLMISGYVGISVAAYLHNKRSKTESRRKGHTKEPPERLISLHEAKR